MRSVGLSAPARAAAPARLRCRAPRASCARAPAAARPGAARASAFATGTLGSSPLKSAVLRPGSRSTAGSTSRRLAASPVALLPEITQTLQGIWGPAALEGFGLPDAVGAVTNLPALTVETVADLAVSVVAIFGAGALINDPGDLEEATETGGGDGRGGRFGNGGGGGDDYDKWYFEDPDGEASNFFIRGGAAGVWWILLCVALSAWCFLIGKAPHLGAMWGVIALGVGWGMFVAVAVGAVGLVALAVLVDTGLRLSRHEVYNKKNELSKSVETAMLGEDIDHTARAADRRNVSANANLKLPDDVQVMGTDAQLVQIGLKAGEELSAEPGSMAYMSPNVRSITSLQGGVYAGLQRLLAGEPFFLNNFKNISKESRDGYIALAGRREGDKIIVLDLSQMGGEFLCARDSYLCSKGDVDIGAASTFMRGQMGLRLFLSNQNTIFMQKLTGTGIACISGNGTVIRQDLTEGQEMVVDARAVVGFSNTINYQLRMMSSPLAAIFGGEGLFFARLSGPGTFFLQSLPAARQGDGLSEEGEVAV